MNITDNKAIALYFEELLRYTKNAKAAANWLMGEIKSHLNENGIEIVDFPIHPERIAALIQLIEEGKISTSVATQRIFPELLKTAKSPIEIATELNVFQEANTDVIDNYINQVIEENKSEIERYRNGEKQLIGFFMGQLMKVSAGKADPKKANGLLRTKLDSL